MRRCQPVAISLALAIAAGVMVLASQADSRPQPTHDAQPEHEEHEDALHEHMEAMKADLKRVAADVTEPGKSLDEALASLAKLQEHVLAAKLLTPDRVEEASEGERSAEQREFRRRLAEVLGELAKIEVHLLDDDREKAWAIISGPLYQMRETGHDRFQ